LVEEQNRIGSASATPSLLEYLNLSQLNPERVNPHTQAAKASPLPLPALIRARRELLPLLALMLGTFYLLSGFATGRLVGSGDALWYIQVLGDTLTQLRSGIFPVWVGQTDFAANGAVYPLRVAPYYQYLGGLIDAAGARSMSIVAVHNSVVVLTGILGSLSAYACMRTLLRKHPWRSAALAWLYVTCPAGLALITAQDLIMSWMTLPFIPIAWLGVILINRESSPRSLLITAVGLGALWWCHSPIACGMTLAAFVSLAIAWVWPLGRPFDWRTVGFVAISFAALICYPFISLWSVRQADRAGVIPFTVDRHRLLENLRHAFPGSLMPVSASGMELRDFQLGFTLLTLATVIAAIALRFPGRTARVSTILLCVGLILVWPFSPLTDWIWERMPGSIVDLAFFWPMQRIYLPLAGLIVLATAAVLADQQSRAVTLVLNVCLAAGVLWSTQQAAVFHRLEFRRRANYEDTELRMRAENRSLMNHSYGLFPRLPPTFSNGVVDPLLGLRLLASDLKTVIEQNDALTPQPISMEAASGVFETRKDPNPGIWDLSPNFTLTPGKRLIVTFDFQGEQPSGILQLEGQGFFRQYILPQSGEDQAWGCGPNNSRRLSLWTTEGNAVSVRIRYIPTPALPMPPTLWHFYAQPISEATWRFRTVSQTPLTLETQAASAGWLETPRMYLPGYKATVNGGPALVRASANGLAAVQVPAGRSRLVVTYVAPFWVRGGFAISAIAWCGMGFLGVWSFCSGFPRRS